METVGRCPTCSKQGIPVIWGKPARETLRAHDLGLARAGGCIVRGGPDTTWWCRVCEDSFQGLDTSVAVQRAKDLAG